MFGRDKQNTHDDSHQLLELEINHMIVTQTTTNKLKSRHSLLFSFSFFNKKWQLIVCSEQNILVKSLGTRKARHPVATNKLTSWRSRSEIFNTFCCGAQSLLSLLFINNNSCVCKSLPLGPLAHALCNSLPRVADTHSPWSSASCLHTSKRVDNTTICLWEGFFNALLANLIYISGRLIFCSNTE